MANAICPPHSIRSNSIAGDTWGALNRRIVACDRCPRLREYCRLIASEKRKAYLQDDYWGRPVPNFGDPRARLLIVGLAPAAHGANRTGRMFTGDRSGEWLFRALHRAGFANRPHSDSRDDGLVLTGCAICAVCHCAPPDNKPAPGEIANCRAWLEEAFDALEARVFVALGGIAWRETWKMFRQRGWSAGGIPAFSHGARVDARGGRVLLGSYHPIQQNTFTGRLTEAMLDGVFRDARAALDSTEERPARD